MSLNIIKKPSPNFSNRPTGSQITTIVLHSTGGSASGALSWMTNPKSEISAHYMVDRDGVIYQLVDESKKAWHAGVSAWKGRAGVNNFSIGIEIENDGLALFPLVQIEAVADLVNEKRTFYNISDDDIVFHSQIAPGRKVDPGIKFPWVRFGRLLQEKSMNSVIV